MYITKYKYDTLTLSASAYNTKITVEIPTDSDVDDIFCAFESLMKGLGFPDGSLMDLMYTRVELDKVAQISLKEQVRADIEFDQQYGNPTNHEETLP